MKRILILLLLLSGLGATAEPHRLVVVTAFPHYDWTRQILGPQTNRIGLVLLQRSGADLHSYRPSAADLRQIARCDLFIHIGGESDEWVAGALAQEGNPGRRVLNLLKALGTAAKSERHIEGMEHEHHDHGKGTPEQDEHIWLSLRNADRLCAAITDALAAIDPEGAPGYRRNAAAYRAELAALDRAYADMTAKAVRRTILVADRFPFRYLADDYGLTYFAAFSGCAAESEASFKTILFLARKTDELKLPVILTLEGTSHRIAETVRDTSRSRNARILALDSLQSVTAAAADHVTYLDVMRRNLTTLETALAR